MYSYIFISHFICCEMLVQSTLKCNLLQLASPVKQTDTHLTEKNLWSIGFKVSSMSASCQDPVSHNELNLKKIVTFSKMFIVGS